MDKRRQRNAFNGYALFLLFGIGVFAILSIAYSVTRIQNIQSRFNSAIFTTNRIITLSHDISEKALSLNSIKKSDAYDTAQDELKSLVYTLKIWHFSLFRGNPDFAVNQQFNNDIKSIYYHSSHNAGTKTREFISAVEKIQILDFKQARKDASSWNLPLQGVQDALGQAVRGFQTEREERVYQVLIYLICGLIGIFAVGILSAIWLMPFGAVRSTPIIEDISSQAVKNDSSDDSKSVSVVLEDFVLEKEPKYSNW